MQFKFFNEKHLTNRTESTIIKTPNKSNKYLKENIRRSGRIVQWEDDTITGLQTGGNSPMEGFQL
jgi:hypothetical protein